MGGASSSLGKAETYAQKANEARELSDHILNVFFNNADYKDLLSLSSISACPTYMFTTADALEGLFQKIQVVPSLGKKGEIMFAPISKLSPGLLKDKAEGTKEFFTRTSHRNRLCMDVAYFYVRVFQIYSALALTVMDTDPTRRVRLVALKKPVAAPAVFFGGGLAQTNPIRKQMIGTPFEPLINYFNSAKGAPEYLQMDADKTKAQQGIFYIKWVNPSIAEKSQAIMTLEAIYKSGIEKNVPVKMVRDTLSQYTFYINDVEIQKFVKSIGAWEFLYDDGSSKDAAPFFQSVHEYFEQFVVATGAAAPGKAPVLGQGQGQGQALQKGKSVFTGFEEIKKLYDDRFAGKGFPKSYCIARAMTLLNPLFDTELLDKRQPFYSQICRKTYDFEPVELMPRAGRFPSSNIYLKSLVGLYYDDYQFKGTDVAFTQSESGRSELQEASEKFAKLYGITTDPKNFLESSTTQFKQFSFCTKQDTFLQLTPALTKKLQVDILQPMLNLQAQHTVLVNNLLKKMFDVKVEKGQATMRFQETLKKGGRAKLDELGREAHDLLLNYYLKSEAYYIKGAIIIEKNPSEYKAVF